MKFKKKYWYGITFGIILLIIDILFFKGNKLFIPFIVLSVTLGWAQAWTDYFIESQRKKEYEGRFLDFVRNLVGAIKSGMPVPNAIIHTANKSEYGSLNPHIKKLANHVEWSIPVHKALKNFARETENDVIIRSVSTVIEAELAGGNIEDVLESITSSLVEIKKIKDQRRASVYSQVLQSYIIFFVFLGIMLIIQNLLIPYLGKMSGANLAKGSIGTGQVIGLAAKVPIDFSSVAGFFSTVKIWFISLQGVFLMLALIQGLFAGLIIGKLSEGNMASGFKHSLILMTIAFIIMSFAQG
jgi:archaeal flagellar protein FlaJ